MQASQIRIFNDTPVKFSGYHPDIIGFCILPNTQVLTSYFVSNHTLNKNGNSRTFYYFDVFSVLVSTTSPKARHCLHGNSFLNLVAFSIKAIFESVFTYRKYDIRKEQKVLIVKLWYKFESPVDVRRSSAHRWV